ncbi:SbcC/MukB-like Walker B domain-containing protein [Lactobacillus delbrueckii subsp. bulgaricus]|nr:chromosome partitioning protein ParA [Lactobacillus delbrueckii subsp. bulgaricus]MBT8918733.1 chromosome partitioning protein ParA [Lactobacillus delbrueckii subsp. bulgaricus]MBT8921166.1 chromosome partitioning protein ParA [Lactobacillus delbrueckii subsp. bulgaricus]MBT8929528.1 chromosome partitioning protein ParA [Lactobacillus delbrueckii subsp. bulgaricus]
MTNYKLNRFGFYNYFNYRNQTFDANTQSIVFNGENGSGKTATMLSLFPTIFLGSMRVVDNKRSLDYYIKAGEAGFAWVEFKADYLLQTLLLAYSKSADGSNTNHYYYVLKQGVKGDDLPYSTSWPEFRGAVNPYVEHRYETQADYQNAINQLFFGFASQSEMQEYFEHLAAFEKPPLKQTGSTAELDSALKTALPNLSHYADRATVENFIDNALAMVEEEKKKAELDKLNNALAKTEEWETLTNKPTLAQIQNFYGKAKTELGQKQEQFEKLKASLAETEEAITQLKSNQASISKDLKAKEGEQQALQTVIDAKNLDQLSRKIAQTKDERNNRERDSEAAQKDRKNAEERLLTYTEDARKEKNALVILEGRLATTKTELAKYQVQADFEEKYPDAKELLKKQKLLLDKLDKLSEQNQELATELGIVNQAINAFDETIYTDNIASALAELDQETSAWLKEREISFDQVAEFDLDVYEDRRHLLENARGQYQEAIAETKNDIRLEKAQLKQLSSDLEKLQEQPKPETTAVFKDGKQLFELVDFKEGVPSNLQLQLESDLKYSNLLYALFDGQEIKTGLEADGFTANVNNVSTKDLPTLADYLVSQDDRVNAFLQAIAVKDGHISYASVNVHSEKGTVVTHIGESNRQKERERQITLLTEEINQVKQRLADLADKLASYQELFKQADPATFPKSDKVTEAQIAYNNALAEQDKRLKKQEKLQVQLADFHRQKEQFTSELCPDLPAESKEFADYRLAWDKYQDKQVQRIMQENDLLKQKDRLASAESRIKQARAELSEKTKQVQDKQDRLTEIKAQIATLEKQLEEIRNDPETKKQLARKEELDQLLKELEKQLNEIEFKLERENNHLTAYQERLPEKQAAYEDLDHEYAAVSDLLEKLNLTEKVKDASPNDWNSEQVKASNQSKANLAMSAVNSINDKTDYRVDNSKRLEFEDVELSDYLLVQVQNLLHEIAVVHYYYGGQELELSKLYDDIRQQLESFQASADDEVQRLARYLNNSTILQKIRQATAEATTLTKQISKSLKEKEQTSHISFYTSFSEIPDYRKDYLAAFGNTSIDSPESQNAVTLLMDRFWTYIKDNNDEMTRDELVDHFYEEFDYKKWYRFNISFRRHAGDAPEKMTDRKLNAFSEGQRSRAILEPLLIVLELDEKKMSNPLAPKIILMDESFSGIDDEQQELLLKNIYDIADNFIATGYNARLAVPENSKDTTYFTLIDHTVDGKNHFISVEQSIVRKNR